MFELNEGQSKPPADYFCRAPGYSVLIAANELDFSVESSSISAGGSTGCTSEFHRLEIRLVGANRNASTKGWDEAPGKVNYLFGTDAAMCRAAISTYARVEYQDIYPGVSVAYHGHHGDLEYDFTLSPNVDPDTIALEFVGADNLQLNAEGDLIVQASGSRFQLRKPFAYQTINGKTQGIHSEYAFENKRLIFQVGSYDRTKPLVIDPVLVYSSTLGSNENQSAYAITLDQSGNIYIAGSTDSRDFPVMKPLRKRLGGETDAFVVKLSSDGSKVLFSTYIGGSGADVAYGIAVDPTGNVYITGDTRSTDFPIAKPFQSTIGGDVDVFVTKLSSDGSKLLYSTFLGGTNGERGNGIAVDASGGAYVTGYTNSPNFPTANALQKTFAGGNADAFVLKLSPTGDKLIYSTYLGGGNDRPDIGRAIAVDSHGNTYVTGFTNSRDFPTVKPLQPFRGPTDVFVSKISPSGSAFVYSTHLGGNADDEGMAIAVDGSENAYVTGHTESVDFPTTPGAFSTSCVAVDAHIPIGNICSGGDAFVSQISADGSRLVYSTYLNGTGFEVGRGIAVDPAGSAYVTGFTSSSDFPTVNPLQKNFAGESFDAFVVQLNPAGSGLVYSTYLGGSSTDGAYGIVADKAGNAYVTGFTESTDFPTRSPLKHLSPNASPEVRRVFVAEIGAEQSSR